MILTFFSSLILGGVINQYGSEYIYYYFYPIQPIINGNIDNKELCIKCKIFTEKSIPHCANCGKCHNENLYKICNECNMCIFHRDYNIHTKKYCCDKFIGQDGNF
jgi:hypothetical protein